MLKNGRSCPLRRDGVNFERGGLWFLFFGGEFSPLVEGEKFADLLVLGGALSVFRDEPVVSGRNEAGEEVRPHDVGGRHGELTGLRDDAVHFVVRGGHVEDVRDAILHGDVDILRDVRALFVDDHFFRFDEGFGDFGSLVLPLHLLPTKKIHG